MGTPVVETPHVKLRDSECGGKELPMVGIPMEETRCV